MTTSIDVGDFFAGPAMPDLFPGGVYWQTNTIALPSSVSGSFYLFVQADAYSQIFETNKNNNVSSPISGTVTILPPDLAPIAFQAPPTVTASQPNPTITVSWGVTNQGPGGTTVGWYDTVWFSTNGVFDTNSVDVGDFYVNQSLAPGAVYRQTNSVILPMSVSGSFTLFVQVDAYNYVFESNKLNNVSSGVSGTFSLGPAPDLAPVKFVLATNSVVLYPTGPQTPTVQVSWLVTNQGNGSASGYWYDDIYISTNNTIAGAVNSANYWEYWATNYGTAPLNPGGSYGQTNTVYLPPQSGSYYLILSVNDGHNLFESNYANNVSAAVPITVTYQVRPPDLVAVAAAAATNSVTFYPPSPQPPTVQFSWLVTNVGVGPAVGVWYDEVYISTNTTLMVGGSARFWEYWDTIYGTMPIPPGGSYGQTNAVTLPEQSGSYYLILSANDGRYLFESNYANNVAAAVPITVAYQVRPPDLAVVSAAITPSSVASTQPYPSVQVTWGVTNQGTGTATGGWFDRVWSSANGLLDGQSIDLGDFYQGQSVTPGARYPDGYSAYQLLSQIGVTNALSVRMLDSQSGLWRVAGVQNGGLIGEDFSIPNVAVVMLNLLSPVNQFTPQSP